MPFYNHNDHYTELLLRQAPRGCRAALDVGCGEGRLLLKLAAVSDEVVGIDPDAASIGVARQTAAGVAELIHGDFLDHAFGDRHFDFITAVASVHHMPLSQALQKMSGVLRPRGTVGVVGLYRTATLADHLIELAAVPVNAGLAWSRSSSPMSAPAIDPTLPLQEIRTTAARILPGVKIRRLLLWRYLLTWTKPGTDHRADTESRRGDPGERA